MIVRNALHEHHFCVREDERKLLETYECGQERVEYVKIGVCCSCSERRRLFGEEHLEDSRGATPPIWFQGGKPA